MKTFVSVSNKMIVILTSNWCFDVYTLDFQFFQHLDNKQFIEELAFTSDGGLIGVGDGTSMRWERSKAYPHLFFKKWTLYLTYKSQPLPEITYPQYRSYECKLACFEIAEGRYGFIYDFSFFVIDKTKVVKQRGKYSLGDRDIIDFHYANNMIMTFYRNKICLRGADTFEPINTIEHHDMIRDVAVSSTLLVAVGGYDGVHLYQNQKQFWFIPFQANKLFFSPDGRYLLIWRNKEINVFVIATRVQKSKMRAESVLGITNTMLITKEGIISFVRRSPVSSLIYRIPVHSWIQQWSCRFF